MRGGFIDRKFGHFTFGQAPPKLSPTRLFRCILPDLTRVKFGSACPGGCALWHLPKGGQALSNLTWVKSGKKQKGKKGTVRDAGLFARNVHR